MNNIVRRNFPVKGMGCASCVLHVENALKSKAGVSRAAVSLASNMAQVDYDPDIVTPKELRKAVQDSGYDLIISSSDGNGNGHDSGHCDGSSDMDDEEEADEEAERVREDAFRKLKHDTVLSVILAVLIMLVGMGFKDFPGKGYVLWGLATLSVAVCGWRFIRNAWLQMRHGMATMDTLVALSTVISYLFSVFNVLFPEVWRSRGIEPHLYFESSAMIVMFILAGRMLEEKAKHSTSASIRGLMSLRPERKDIHTGDIVLVRPGDRIPVDGKVVEGEISVDESMLTGEPEAAVKQAGDKVYTGTINLRGDCSVLAEKVGKDTMLSSIIRTVRDAQGTKARIQNTVDKVAAVFVPVIVIISVATLVCWLVFAPEQGLAHGLMAMVSVLVIACPCSLGLATPTALIAGIGNAAGKGILIKDADALQIAGKINVLGTDKTGTLTNINLDEGTESVKKGAAEAVSSLEKKGIDVYMLSGDKADRAAKVASETGITHVLSGCLPADKNKFITDMQSEGKKVAMAGDGINDSSALASADLSIAMGNGADIAMNAAMVTIVSSDLRKIPELIDISRRTSRIIYENLFWAFIYNVLAVPVAAGILYPFNGFMINPMVAAACMALSSVCVVVNSLRLRLG